MQGHDDCRASEDRVVGVTLLAEDRRRTGVPVVQVQDVERPPVGPHGFEGGPAQQPEAPGVVGIVSGGVAVQPVPLEGRRVVDESEPVAVRTDIDDRDLARAGGRPRVGHTERPLALDRRRIQRGQAAVARQKDIDRRDDLVIAQAPEGPCERVDHIGQPAGLGPRLALRGDERNAQSHCRRW